MKIPSHWQAFVCLFEYIEQDAYFSFFNMLKEKHVEEVWSTGHFRVSGMGKCSMSSTTCQIFRPFSQPVHPHWGKVFVIHIIDMRSLTRKPSMIHICLTSFPSGHFSINIGVWKHTLVFCEELLCGLLRSLKNVNHHIYTSHLPLFCGFREGLKWKLNTQKRCCDCCWLTSMQELWDGIVETMRKDCKIMLHESVWGQKGIGSDYKRETNVKHWDREYVMRDHGTLKAGSVQRMQSDRWTECDKDESEGFCESDKNVELGAGSYEFSSVLFRLLYAPTFSGCWSGWAVVFCLCVPCQ